MPNELKEGLSSRRTLRSKESVVVNQETLSGWARTEK